MNRYRPESLPRAAALTLALALTGATLAAIDSGAAPARDATLAAAFTGEVTAAGPVYRLPGVAVTARRPLDVARPGFVDRVLGRAPRDAARPSA